MKKLIAICITVILICSLSISIVACKDGDTNTDPLVGKWASEDGSYFEFKKDGTGTRTLAGSSTETLEWGLVKGSRFEGIFSDCWTYYAIIGGTSQNVIDKIETDSNGNKFIEVGRKYYRVS